MGLEELQQGFWGDAQYLDAVSAQDAVQRYKRRTYALLDARPGARILDVGCGIGDDVRAMAELVGSTGQVVGVDVREEMIAEARGRSVGLDLPVEFLVGSLYQLDFADDAFDGCRADRVYQHLDRPQDALAEMTRVTRSGGRIVVFDVDWETLAIDMPDRIVTRKILNWGCDMHGSGWVGRSLLRLFRTAGLQDIVVEPITAILTDFATADSLFGFREDADAAQAAGVITADEGQAWLNSLEQARREGWFFCALTCFTACGRKP
jgi:ubiquinone/menaquinone biosynthesis C-methylase UbiE